jgi:hypothetical protein
MHPKDVLGMGTFSPEIHWNDQASSGQISKELIIEELGLGAELHCR